ncbi:glycogen operon protein [Herbihabitans rhizosphaerae]|uniref:Glycogen operon protein n=1 Tax=Herbihabitans rhizosphaerae TaxID=1872711 RepID=A0A4Q7KRC4_9PSEU|nr:glycogen operon protein [Herbihabitans rhizosphaerae]
MRFAVASTVAEAVEVCLVDERDGVRTERRVELTERTFGVWHGVIPGVTSGQRYGFRVHGPYRPADGPRCNPAKLLVDPYARRVSGTLSTVDTMLDYKGDNPFQGTSSDVDSLPDVPLSVVTAPGGTGTGIKPDTPFEETVIYELHVRGFTMRHPDVPPEQRGTYLGLAHPSVIDYLVRLGVTAVELMPVHAIADEPPLLRTGRRNYWGYSTLAFHAPHPGYASVPGNEVEEFRTMVAALHAAGLEVIMDVVFNHTCEGDAFGPSLSLRGLDAGAYYLLDDGSTVDWTGCGNTLDPASPSVVRLVTDSLRYFAGELGVDGFRFDLATVLGRTRDGFDPASPLLTAITTDPVLASAKLIAEPWDATADGYRLGEFGPQWTEWNGRFRDTARDFWRGATGVRDLAYRLSGSEDVFARTARRPWASINFVTAHDGFTLRDLVSYVDKHNDANGEDNRDGTDDNRADNLGVEGDTSDEEIRARRATQARALLATVLLSTGTPMLVAGDERWRTQGGNNNPYCLDDETSWLDWESTVDSEAMLSFARKVIALRAHSPALRQPAFFDGRPTRSGEPDLVWFSPAGEPMTDADWFDDGRRCLSMWIDGSESLSRTRDGELVSDDSWLIVLHAGTEPIEITLPEARYGEAFLPELDTVTPDGVPAEVDPVPPRARVTLPPRSLRVYRVRTTT